MRRCSLENVENQLLQYFIGGGKHVPQTPGNNVKFLKKKKDTFKYWEGKNQDLGGIHLFSKNCVN